MRWSSALAAAFAIAATAYAAEQKAAPNFDAVPAPQITLQQSDLDATPPAVPQAPNAPAPEQPASAPTAWWGELQQGLDRELDQAGAAGPSAASQTTPAATEAGRSAGESVLRAIVATCVVVALILVCYYLAGRYGKKSPLLAGLGLGRILGRIHLSPKAELYFVRVKDRVLVVGVTANEVSRVAEFDAALFDETQPAAAVVDMPAPQPSAFAQELRAQSKPEPTESAVSEELAALKAELDKARQYFRETSGEPGGL